MDRQPRRVESANSDRQPGLPITLSPPPSPIRLFLLFFVPSSLLPLSPSFSFPRSRSSGERASPPKKKNHTYSTESRRRTTEHRSPLRYFSTKTPSTVTRTFPSLSPLSLSLSLSPSFSSRSRRTNKQQGHEARTILLLSLFFLSSSLLFFGRSATDSSHSLLVRVRTYGHRTRRHRKY